MFAHCACTIYHTTKKSNFMVVQPGKPTSRATSPPPEARELAEVVGELCAGAGGRMKQTVCMLLPSSSLTSGIGGNAALHC